MGRQSVSVIVPGFNSRKYFSSCVLPLYRLTQKLAFDFLYVDDGSSDGSIEELMRLGIPHLALAQNIGAAKARNAGASQLPADILVFIDSDIYLTEEALFALVFPLLEDPHLSATGAVQAPALLPQSWHEEVVALRSYLPYLRLPPHSLVPLSGFQSECGAICAKAFWQVGGFSEKYSDAGMEEFDLGHKLERQRLKNVLVTAASYQVYTKPVSRRCHDLWRRSSLWVELFLKRKKVESQGSTGNAAECVSVALTGTIFLSALASFFYPGPFFFTTLVVIALLQIVLERDFLSLAQHHAGVGFGLYSYAVLQFFNLAIAFGVLHGLSKQGRIIFATSVKN